jgi:predicted aspartyl protease
MVTVGYQGRTINISDVLVDTGSASTILAADCLTPIGIEPSADDILLTIRGIGGIEVVYLRKVDFLEVGESKLSNFEMEEGGMDYGFAINGILGMDFLKTSGAIINLHEMRLDFLS